MATVALELCICSLMVAAVAVWFSNAVKVTQDSGFLTRQEVVFMFAYSHGSMGGRYVYFHLYALDLC